jgi:predicted nucleic acid-binding Zn ribbon protein
MNFDEALNILELPQGFSVSDAKENYKLKKSQFLAKEFSGEDVRAQVNQLDEAYECIIKVFSQPEEREKDIGPSNIRSLISSADSNQKTTLSTTDNLTLNNTYNCLFCGHTLYKGETICENCGKQLLRHCPHCGEYIEVGTLVCRHCQVPVREYDKKRFAQILSIEQDVKKKRQETEINAVANEEINKKFEHSGFILWFLIILFVILICGISVYLFMNNYMV